MQLNYVGIAKIVEKLCLIVLCYSPSLNVATVLLLVYIALSHAYIGDMHTHVDGRGTSTFVTCRSTERFYGKIFCVNDSCRKL